MNEYSVHGKRAVVVGGAASGTAAAHLLVDRGAHVTLTDLRTAIDGQAGLQARGVTLVLGEHPVSLFTAADLVVVSPGVPLTQTGVVAARGAGVPVVGEIELASRWLRGRIVAITGTKGKSTTTALTGRILEQAGRHAPVGGNIGTPLSGQVAESRPDTLHVVEVSSFQLETTDTFHPWIAVLLNLTADHLDRHADLDEYVAAKARIFARQIDTDVAVVNADDPQTLELARCGKARLVQFGLHTPVREGVTVSAEWVVERHGTTDTQLVRTADVRLIGPHLLADVLAAAAIGTLAGASPAVIASAVSSFSGLEHAMEWVGDIGGVRFVNDSKATNVDAARQAIETFSAGLVVIMGGRFKGGDLRTLRRGLVERRATVVAIGDARPLIHDALGDAVTVAEAGSMVDAVRVAFEAARTGGSVLLAPACASFDMFEDYAARGRAFKTAVARLRDEEGGDRETA